MKGNKRHRSVYFVERMAERLSGTIVIKYRLEICH